jgi:hypothetical protein
VGRAVRQLPKEVPPQRGPKARAAQAQVPRIAAPKAAHRTNREAVQRAAVVRVQQVGQEAELQLARKAKAAEAATENHIVSPVALYHSCSCVFDTSMRVQVIATVWRFTKRGFRRHRTGDPKIGRSRVAGACREFSKVSAAHCGVPALDLRKCRLALRIW